MNRWQRLVALLVGAYIGAFLHRRFAWARSWGAWVAGHALVVRWRRSGELGASQEVTRGAVRHLRDAWVLTRLVAWVLRQAERVTPDVHPSREPAPPVAERFTGAPTVAERFTSAPTNYELTRHSRVGDAHRMCEFVDAENRGCGMFRDAHVHTSRALLPQEATLEHHPFVPGQLAPAENAIPTPCQSVFIVPDDYPDVPPRGPGAALRCTGVLWHDDVHTDGTFIWTDDMEQPDGE